MSETLEPRAWVGCLACYNGGGLVGEWVAATEAEDYEPCPRVDHEEYWVFDHEDLLIESECSPTAASERARELAAIPDYIPADAIRAYVDNDDSACLSELEDRYMGEYESDIDFTQSRLEEITPDDIWEIITTTVCIDWQRTADELRHDCAMLRRNGATYVFRNH